MSINQEILKGLNQRPIALYPIYIDITGSLTAGLVLSQIMYWFSISDSNKIYKTNDELMQETRLSENELRTAKKKLKELKFLTISKQGLPARTFYEIDWAVYALAISELNQKSDKKIQTSGVKRDSTSSVKSAKTSGVKTDSASSVKSTRQVKSNPHDPIKINKNQAEITTEITTKTTTENLLPPIIPQLQNEIDPELFADFVKFRKEIKAPLTPIALKLLQNKLLEFKTQGHDINEILKTSIQNGWRGVFALKQNKTKTGQTNEPKFSLDECVRFRLIPSHYGHDSKYDAIVAEKIKSREVLKETLWTQE